MAAQASKNKIHPSRQEDANGWSTREKLILSCSVLRSGDQNWVSVSRTIRPICESVRPRSAEWFSQKNCAQKYADLLESVDTPKRKRTASEPGGTETPQEQILRRLTFERIEELKNSVKQDHEQYRQLKQDIESIRSGKVDLHLKRIWEDIQSGKDVQIDQFIKDTASEGTSHQNPQVSQNQTPLTQRPRQQRVTKTTPKFQTYKEQLKQQQARYQQHQNTPQQHHVHQHQSNLHVQQQDQQQQQQQHMRQQDHQPIQTQQQQLMQQQQEHPVQQTPKQEPQAATPSPPQKKQSPSLLPSQQREPMRQQPHKTPLAPQQQHSDPQEQQHVVPRQQRDILKSNPAGLTTARPTAEPTLDGTSDKPSQSIVPADSKETPSVTASVADASISQSGKQPRVNIAKQLADEQSGGSNEPEGDAPSTSTSPTNLASARPSVDVPAATVSKTSDKLVIKDEVVQLNVEEDDTSALQPSTSEEATNDATAPVEESDVDQQMDEETIPTPVSSHDADEVIVRGVSEKSTADDKVASEDVELPAAAEDSKAVAEDVIDAVQPAAVSVLTSRDASMADEDSRPASDQDPVDSDDVPLRQRRLSHSSGRDKLRVLSDEETTNPDDSLDRSSLRLDDTRSDLDSSSIVDVTETQSLPSPTPKRKSRGRQQKHGKRKSSVPVKPAEDTGDESAGSADEPISDREDAESERASVADPKELTEVDSIDEDSRGTTVDLEVYDKLTEKDLESSRIQAVVSSPASPALSTGSNCDPETAQAQKTWRKSIMLVWKAAASHRYANVFLHPVTNDEAPGYHDVIHRPMDLQTIKKNIETGLIRTTSEFQRDMMLMFQNAIMYNSADHDVFRMAQEMRDDVMEQIQSYIATQLMMQSSDRDSKMLRGHKSEATIGRK